MLREALFPACWLALLLAAFASQSLGASTSLRLQTYYLGNNNEFSITLSDHHFNPSISIFYLPKLGSAKDNELWSSAVGLPFVAVGIATPLQPPILNGNYQVNYTLSMVSTKFVINSTDTAADHSHVSFLGELWDDANERVGNFQATFSLDTNPASSSSASVRFAVNASLDAPLLGAEELHTVLTYSKHRSESFFGMGEQFTLFNLDHQVVPVLVSEQGVGRGLEPLTTAMNVASPGSGGMWFTTYAPKAVYLTTSNRSLLLDTTLTSNFDFTKVDDNIVQVEVWGGAYSGRFLLASSWLNLIERITETTGRQPVLASWTQQGAILGLEGGTKNVSAIVDKLYNAGVQIAGVWLQDWVGLRHGTDGDRLIWNWELNPTQYPKWDEMVDKWAAKGIRVLTYINPFFSDPTNFSTPTHNYFQEGLEKDYFVRNEQGDVYMMKSLTIDFATLDLTNTNARAWMKNIIIDEMLVNARSSGFMADFGEYLPFDAVMSDGQSGAAYHNLYPQAWAELVAEALADAKARPVALTDVIFFTRSAWMQSSRSVPVFWLGDQLQSWDVNDGLASVIVGAISGGLTGHAVTHSDIGGYNAVTGLEKGNPALQYIRSHELLRRWTELGAFGFGLMRTHIGSSMDADIAQVYNDPTTIAHFAKFSHIFANLSTYRTLLLEEASLTGHPMVRSMALHYAYDSQMTAETTQYLFGADFIVAPTLYEESNFTMVDFPIKSGAWVHLWGGNVVHSGDGRYLHLRVPTPVGFPGVFYRQGSLYGNQLRAFVMEQGYDDGFNWEYNDDPPPDADDDYDPIGTLTLSEKILIPLFFLLLLASLAWLFMAFYHETLAACFPACCAGDDQQTVYLSQASRRVVDKIDPVDIPRYSTHSSLSSGQNFVGSKTSSVDRTVMPTVHEETEGLLSI